MNSINKLFRALDADETGATATEYLVLLICIACFIILAAKVFGFTLEEKYRWADQRVSKFVTF